MILILLKGKVGDMMTVVENLKARLFDLTYIDERNKRKKLKNHLPELVKETLHASNAVFFIYHKWELQKDVVVISSNRSVNYQPSSVSNFIDFFEKQKNLTSLEKNNPLVELNSDSNVLLKIHKNELLYTLVILEFEDKVPYQEETLNEIQKVLQQFLLAFYDRRKHEFIHSRHEIMFQLSTKLHSVYDTVEVLEKVHQTSQLVYPSFDFYFLMSHELDCCKLPVKLIEYTKETAENPGIIAFINDKLQIEYDEEKGQTHIYAPLSGKQGVYGVYQIVIPTLLRFANSEIQFIKDISGMIGRAIERTTLYQSSNKRASDLQNINIASHELNLSLHIHDISETVKKHIFNSCYADQIGIVLFENEFCDKSTHILEESTDYFKTEDGEMFIDSIHHEMKVNRKPFFSGNYESEVVDFPYKSLMALPMNSSDAIIGMIVITHPNPYYFSFDTFKFIQTYVQHAALAFTNSILTERLKRLATTDYLTKLYSRNHMDDLIKSHMQENGQGAFILFDVDDFKKVNDTYGHYVGDKVLIQVANAIKAEMEDNQIAARWGGEEFAVYLPGADIIDSTEKAEQIRKRVNKETDPRVTLSCGVSVWTKYQEDSIEQLFIRADKALYEAKSTGKNKVVQNVC